MGPAILFTVSAIEAPARPTAQSLIYDIMSENTLVMPNTTEMKFLKLSSMDFNMLPL